MRAKNKFNNFENFILSFSIFFGNKKFLNKNMSHKIWNKIQVYFVSLFDNFSIWLFIK